MNKVEDLQFKQRTEENLKFMLFGMVYQWRGNTTILNTERDIDLLLMGLTHMFIMPAEFARNALKSGTIDRYTRKVKVKELANKIYEESLK